jgi:RNA recognition motif-containing protein
MRTLYVGGLPADATADSLRSIFARFGALEAARVVMRSTTGTCRGFGYVTFTAEPEAQRAMTELDGRVVQGNRWRVDLVR